MVSGYKLTHPDRNFNKETVFEIGLGIEVSAALKMKGGLSNPISFEHFLVARLVLSNDQKM